jgi:hypothetical protein
MNEESEISPPATMTRSVSTVSDPAKSIAPGDASIKALGEFEVIRVLSPLIFSTVMRLPVMLAGLGQSFEARGASVSRIVEKFGVVGHGTACVKMAS